MSIDLQVVFMLHDLTGRSVSSDGAIVFVAEYVPFLIVGGAGILIYHSRISLVEKLHRGILALFSGAIARVGVVEIIRALYERPRPFITADFQPLIELQSWSFPSAHAAFLFGVVGVLYAFYPRWGGIFVGAVILVCLARITAGVHYPSDIIAGAFVGILTAFVVMKVARYLEKTNQKSKPSTR